MTDVVIASAARTPVGTFLGRLSTLEASELGALAISGREYRHNKHIIGLDLEKAAQHGARGSGVSTRGGELLTLQCKAYTNAGGDVPSRCYVHLGYDALLNISKAGIEVLD